jgi:hypothetical protein
MCFVKIDKNIEPKIDFLLQQEMAIACPLLFAEKKE